jgi:type IV secretory pathway VirB3-like protein
MARGSWGQSKLLTQKSWAIVKENRYLLAFPVLGFIASLVPLALFWVPAGYLALNDQNVAAIGLAIIGIFANQIVISIAGGGLVASADVELSGGDSSVGHGIGRALARLFPLIGWALIATVVNVIVGFVRGQGSGAAGAVRNLAAAGILAMWQIITFFVLPFIMLEGRGPITAIKESFALFRAKWGVQIFGGVRIGGLIGLATILPGILLVVLGFVAAFTGSAALVALGVALIVIGILLFMVGALLISTMKGIFSVVLFRYAKDGALEGGFTEAELSGAIRTNA